MELYNIRGVEVWSRNRGDDWVIGEVIERDFYGLEQLKAEGAELKTVVDVGAHIGTFACFIHRLWPSAKIICFEPNPDNFEMLEKNAPFACNYNYAVRYSPGSVFVTTADATGGGFVCKAEDVERLSEAKHRWDGFNYSVLGNCECVTLEEVFDSEGITEVDLLKLDAELAEMDILSHPHPFHVKRCVGEYHCEGGWPEFKALAEKAMPHLEFIGFTPSRDPIGGFTSKERV